MRRARIALVLPLVVAACGSLNPKGDIPKSTTLIPDATLKVSPNYSITIEKVIYGAAGAALLYFIYDPLAPNWEVSEEQLAEDTYRLSLRMKRFHTGGDGEAQQVFRRWAERLQREAEAAGYQIRDFVEGIESSTPIARRYARGTVRVVHAAAPVNPVALAPVVAAEAPASPTAHAVSPTMAVPLQAPASGSSPSTGRQPAAPRALPKPPPEDADLVGVTHQATLNARALFEFDKAVLTAGGKAVLDRDLVARKADLGQLRLLVVSGHADRIGSYEYNRRLSEARAHAVRDYLVSRGFRHEAVRTIAYGESRPVAGVTCPETLPREAQIACLAPHRRVEVSASQP